MRSLSAKHVCAAPPLQSVGSGTSRSQIGGGSQVYLLFQSPKEIKLVETDLAAFGALKIFQLQRPTRPFHSGVKESEREESIRLETLIS